MKRKPAVVIFRPRGLCSKSDTPSAFSSAPTRRLTAVGRTPSSLAAPLKLRWSATLRAQPIDIGLTAADSVIPLGDDLFRGMITLLTYSRIRLVTDLGSEKLEIGCRFQNHARSNPGLFGPRRS